MTKGNVLTKWMGAGVLGLALIIFPCGISVSAQNANTGTTANQTRDDDGTDYGWIGLLGLAGLAGLLGRKRDDRDRDRDRR